VTGGGLEVTDSPEGPAYAEALSATLEASIDALKIPGVVLLVRSQSKGDWTATFGTRTITGDDPVTRADHFRIGSNTKTMTGTVALQLVQDGDLELDDPVSRFRADVPNGQNISIAMLLAMRSGLYNYSADEMFNARLDADPTYVWHPPELLSIAFAHPPAFSPGADFDYSNTNSVLLGLIIEQLTGSTLAEEFERRIFTPLEMKGTTMPALEDATIPVPHPHGYMFGTNVSTLTDPGVPPSQQAAASDGTLRPNDVTASSPSWTWAAGGAISTAGDLARYVEALAHGELLGGEMQSARLASIRPTGADPDSAGYGFHIAKFGPMIGHDGQIPGFMTFMGCDPEQRNTVIVLTSIFNGPLGQQPANELARAVIAAVYE
jgi:D-alanyl-D-alanine carboxypeptidase